MSSVNTWRRVALASYITAGTALTPLYCKQDIFIFYIQWLIFLLIGNTMKIPCSEKA